MPPIVGMREPEIDRDAARLLFFQPIRIDAGQRLDERALPVIDVPRRADDHGLSYQIWIILVIWSCVTVLRSARVPSSLSPGVPRCRLRGGFSRFGAGPSRAPRAALAVAHPLENVDQAEIDLPQLPC